MLPEYVALAHKPTRAYLVFAAVAAALPVLGLCYISGIVWSRHIITNAADVVAAQRHTFGNPSSGALSLAAAGSTGSSSNSSCQAVIKMIPPPKTRQDIATMLQHEAFEVGAELGVQQGVFAAETLYIWRSCKRYYLVDPYTPLQQQQGRAGTAAAASTGAHAQQRRSQSQLQQEQQRQHQLWHEAQENLQFLQHKLVWMRNSTTDAARLIREPLDYVYLNSSRDYCSVLADIEAWWPLVRPGGVMAGHSYENAVDVMRQSGQDWSHCADGVTVHQGAVQAAVNDFFAQQGLQIVVTYRELVWNSWVVRKPYYPCDSQQAAGSVSHGLGDAPLMQLLSSMLQQTPQQRQQQEELARQEQQEEQGLAPQQQHSAADQAVLLLERRQQESKQEQQENFVHGEHLQVPVKQQQQQQQHSKMQQQAVFEQQQHSQGQGQHVPDQEQQRQQLHAALSKLHDSQGLAAGRAQHVITLEDSSSSDGGSEHAVDEVFGDIFRTHEQQ